MDGKSQKPDYGVDAPGVIRNLFLAGIAGLALYRFLPSVNVGGVTFLLSPMFLDTRPSAVFWAAR